MNVNERATKIRELLGGYQDWPDGSSTYKVWFRDGTALGAAWKPADEELIAWCFERITRAGGRHPSLHSGFTRSDVAGAPLDVAVTVRWATDAGSEGIDAMPATTMREALEELMLAVNDRTRSAR